MFKYSIDELIAGKQKEKAAQLLDDMLKQFRLIPAPEIELLFDKYVKSYDFIEKLHEVALSSGDLIVMPIIPREGSSYAANADLKIAYNKTKKSLTSKIPFIEFSFPDGGGYYKHGYDFQHVYISFFTLFDFQQSHNCIIHYFHKLNNLKAFM